MSTTWAGDPLRSRTAARRRRRTAQVLQDAEVLKAYEEDYPHQEPDEHMFSWSQTLVDAATASAG